MVCLPEEIQALNDRMAVIEQLLVDATGPKGDEGDQGIQGIQGLQGIAGPAGYQATNRVILPFQFGSRMKYPTNYEENSPAIRSRGIPTNCDFEGLKPLIVSGYGHVIPNLTAWEIFCRRNPDVPIGSVAYVNPLTGNNGTGALNNSALPYLTVQYAMESTDARIIIVEDGVIPPVDYRWTERSGQAKALFARNPGRVRMVVTPAAGDTAPELTWTLHAGDCWKATYTGTYGGTQVNCVTRFDVPGRQGFEKALLLVGSIATCQTTPDSYYVDTATKTIYVNLGGPSAQTLRPFLKIRYFDAASQSRVYTTGANVYMDGFIMDGLTCASATHTDGFTTYYPDFFRSNCIQLFPPDHANHDLGSAGVGVRYDEYVTTHGSLNDGMNLNSTGARVAIGVQIGCWVSNSGNTGRNGAVSANRQAASSHSGLRIDFGNVFEGNWGQEVAETSNAGPADTNRTWMCGTLMLDQQNNAAQDGGIGIGVYGSAMGSNLNRKIWVDTCATIDIETGLRVESYAEAKVFNSPSLGPIFVDSVSNPVGAYSPETPNV